MKRKLKLITELDQKEMSVKLWWMVVVGICKRREYGEWFYDEKTKDAWLELKAMGQNPYEAIQTNINAMHCC